uniref:GTPase IMAP family member 8 n=1 Tax=Astyanax mexicanus TaxID=7994 RepID=A0A3B1IFS6_ASTMX
MNLLDATFFMINLHMYTAYTLNCLCMCSLTDEHNSSTVKLVLLGKSGTGKSSTGNNILGREAFVEDVTPESVTVKCEQQDAEREGKSITVIDTPGIFSTSQTNEELKSEVEKCLSMGGPGPTIFLLVINLASRFTEEERNTVKWFLENFGEDISVSTIVLLTHADQLKDKTVKDYIRGSLDLRRIINKCGGRFQAISNEDRTGNRSQVTELLEKVDLLVKTNGNHLYRKEFYEELNRKCTFDNKTTPILFATLLLGMLYYSAVLFILLRQYIHIHHVTLKHPLRTKLF